jgi:hypothetical protein
MPIIQDNVYKSPTLPWAASGAVRFRGAEIPLEGPNGGRNVIDYVDVVVQLNLSNDVAVLEGEDVWRAIDYVTVEQADGVRRYNAIPGEYLRHINYLMLGADAVTEYADIADADTQTLTWKFRIPFERKFTKRGKDYTLPADILKLIEIGCAKVDATGLGCNGNTVAITSGTYQLLVQMHEEFSVEQKVVDMWAVQDFSTSTGFSFKAGGRLQDLHIVKRGAAGGAAITGLTELRIDRLMPDALLRTPDILYPYLESRGAAPNDANAADGSMVHNDPAGAGKLIPVLHTDEDTSTFDGRIMDDVVGRVTSGSLSSGQVLYRVVLPRSEQLERAIMAQYNLSEGDFRLKTEGKTKRRIHEWPESLERFMVRTAPLKSLGFDRAA